MFIPWHSPHLNIFINQLMETKEIYGQETLQKSRKSFDPFHRSKVTIRITPGSNNYLELLPPE